MKVIVARIGWPSTRPTANRSTSPTLPVGQMAALMSWPAHAVAVAGVSLGLVGGALLGRHRRVGGGGVGGLVEVEDQRAAAGGERERADEPDGETALGSSAHECTPLHRHDASRPVADRQEIARG
jgi:hypothetical protein